jgi:hypothetical protein
VVVQAIGFDMDYTLSQYRPETFEVLAYNLTITKLIANFSYPQAGSSSSLAFPFSRRPTPSH